MTPGQDGRIAKLKKRPDVKAQYFQGWKHSYENEIEALYPNARTSMNSVSICRWQTQFVMNIPTEFNKT